MRKKCTACGQAIGKNGKSIAKKVSGTIFYFDSDDCAILYTRLRQVHGDKFLKKLLG
jgi:hypothetical protein